MKRMKYRLWAMVADDEGIVFATKNEFSRVRRGLVLVYTDRPEAEIPEEAVPVTDENAGDLLSEDELRWLTGCNIQVIERVAEECRIPMEKTMPSFLKRLEQELRRARNAEEAGE